VSNCGKRHVGAFVLKWDDGSFTVKCGLLKQSLKEATL